MLVALALLAAAVVGRARRARDTARARHRDAHARASVAALAASPIVWVHYFLLLLVPLALPAHACRCSGSSRSPPAARRGGVAGRDARKLALALAATLVILGAAVLAALTPGWRPALRRDQPLRWSRIVRRLIDRPWRDVRCRRTPSASDDAVEGRAQAALFAGPRLRVG